MLIIWAEPIVTQQQAKDSCNFLINEKQQFKDRVWWVHGSYKHTQNTTRNVPQHKIMLHSIKEQILNTDYLSVNKEIYIKEL